jgi:predicted Zn-dependent peptidase
MSIEFTTLPSGLRVITDTVREVESVALGIWADVGTRHENMDHNGVAHMVEHMMFKGTPTRNALQIAEQIEDVGGQVNAYTSREITAYHVHMLKDDLPLGIDILSDIIQHSTMPDDEIERERDVILQEIGMTADTPDDIIFDNYQETAYPAQALGAPILGRSEIISNMQRDTLQDYVQKFYTPGRLVVAASGHVEHAELLQRVTDLFGDLPADQASTPDQAHYKGGDSRTEKSLEQSHVVIGFEGVGRNDEDYYAAAALSTVLGGGMSSRLFQEVREARGLAYAIDAYTESYEDIGALGIYAGTGAADAAPAARLTAEEIKGLAAKVGDAELARAKAQMKGSLFMRRESPLARAEANAHNVHSFGRLFSAQELADKVDAVSAADIRRVGEHLVASGRSASAVLGPKGAAGAGAAFAETLAAG